MGNRSSNSTDYSRYTYEELEDVLNKIDQSQFPDRYAEAKAMLSKKLKEQNIEPNSDYIQPSNPPLKPKWSKQRLMTRIVFVTFLVMLFSVLPTMFVEFMTSKSWTANAAGVIYLLAFTLVTMWFACLKTDSKLMHRLGGSWRGKLAIVGMPFMFIIMSEQFIDKSLPLYLHMVSVKQDGRYDMDYKKKSGKRYCRHRVEIIETDELNDGDLCMTENERNSLREKGEITVLGNRSQFGMVIDGFNLP